MVKKFSILFLVLFLSFFFTSNFVFSITPKQEETIKSFIIFAEENNIPKEWYPKEVVEYQQEVSNYNNYKKSLLRNFLLNGGN